MPNNTWLSRLSFLSVLFAFCVILLGAYTRLSDAGLGCPDWPGCYGQFRAPKSQSEIIQANQAYPHMPVDVSKAKTEMTHRYFAETLGLLIFLLAILIYRQRSLKVPRWLAPLLVMLVLFQGLLGMWTVSLRLLPIVVMGHLLGGFCTLGLLWVSWLSCRYNSIASLSSLPPFLRTLSLSLLFILFLQISLGGWTSANYAALICPDFPTCQGKWWPNLHLQQAFSPFSQMDVPERTAIHIIHRLGALITFLLGILLSVYLWQEAKNTQLHHVKNWLRRASISLLLLLFIQVGLGISNVLYSLPLSVAVAHNGVAALLFLTLINLCFSLWRARRV